MKTKRTIEEILDLETGRNINAGKLFEEDRGLYIQLLENNLKLILEKGIRDMFASVANKT